jgi:predicted ATPase
VQLIGRSSEIERVAERVREARLVTITGPGGIGKTRLAEEIASIVGPEFEYGSISVDLTRIDRADGVAEAVAGQLGYADFPALVNSTGDQPTLIVLDNCEHVLDTAADVARQVLAACEMPTILATSRSPLDLPGESVVTLGPLEVPPPDVPDVDAPAVHLLLDRARDHGVDPSSVSDDAAAEIARRLDGVPLALELAAARLRSMSTTELLAERGADALSRRRFRGNPSHRSVVDTVQWSIDLLDSAACDAFERLGVFAGPFTSSMAIAIIDDPAARDLLDELIESSLVVADTSDDRTWHRLLHPVRAVALDRLRQRGDLAAVESRWVDHVVEMAVDVVASASAGWSGEILRNLLALYDNLIAALRWTLDHDDDADRAHLLLAVLWGTVHQAHTEEIATVGETVLARWPAADTALSADAAATVATCRNLLGDPAAAIELARSHLVGAEGSSFAPATLRRVMAQATRATGDVQGARDHFLDAAEHAGENGVTGFAMELLVDHGLLVAELGDLDAGLDVIDTVHQQALAEGAAVNAAWAHAGRGTAIALSDPRRGIAELEAALEASRSIAYPAGVSFSLRGLAGARAAVGDDVRAAEALLELIDELLQRGGLTDLRMVLDVAAIVVERRGLASWADLAVTAASLPITSVGTPVHLEIYERADGVGQLLTIREALIVCRRDLQVVVAGAARQEEPAGRVAPTEAAERDDSTELPDTNPSYALVRQGDVWQVAYDGKEVVVTHSKGMADLATLLGTPGREIPAVDLMGAGVVGSGGDDFLDTTARRNYEHRVRALQSAIDEAESGGQTSCGTNSTGSSTNSPLRSASAAEHDGRPANRNGPDRPSPSASAERSSAWPSTTRPSVRTCAPRSRPVRTARTRRPPTPSGRSRYDRCEPLCPARPVYFPRDSNPEPMDEEPLDSA